jgi:hypothetical protein
MKEKNHIITLKNIILIKRESKQINCFLKCLLMGTENGYFFIPIKMIAFSNRSSSKVKILESLSGNTSNKGYSWA